MSTREQKRIYQWLKIIQFFLLPGVCIHCSRLSGRQRDLCQACEAGLPRIPQPCGRCGLDIPRCNPWHSYCGSCLSQPPPFQRLVAPLAYQPPLPGFITAFKYHERLVVGRELTMILADEIRVRYHGQPLPELLIPVPLHPKRLRQRGFNQSLEIARDLARLLDLPLFSRLAARCRKTDSQTGLNARQRRQNLRGAFSIPEPGKVKGKTIAIVDDVITTATTVSELSQTLLRAGAGQVHVWALARTPL